MSNNPLIDKYNEIYGKKEIGIISKSPITLSDPNIPLTSSPTVVNPNSLVGPSPKSSVNANNFFLEIAEKIKNGTAQVTTASLQVDAVGTFSFGKTITFEVYDYEP